MLIPLRRILEDAQTAIWAAVPNGLPIRLAWRLAPPLMRPPTLSIGAASPSAQDGARSVVFTVRLSAASSRAISVRYRTADGSAHGGADYDARAGVLTFAPGQTVRTVTVQTHPGGQPAATFSLVLSAASGAAIGVARATGTLASPPPLLTVEGGIVNRATSDLPGHANLLPAGYFGTRGSQIVDVAGHAVRLNAVNWYGLETPDFAPHGLWAQCYQTMMRQMVALGFNAIRLPFSDQLFDAGSLPSTINLALNPDLAGLSGLGIMDRIVSYAGTLGLKVILDHHRSDAGFGGPNENGLWYQGAYGQTRWLEDWTMLARHYAGDATVIGADLANEPHGPATWGDGGANDWAAAATRAGNAIQAINPDWLIIVEGTEQYDNHWTWWGGNLMGVADHPVSLSHPNQVVYSPHDYPASITDLPPFHAADYPNNFPALWNQYWGFINSGDIAPVFLGEFGSELGTVSDRQWMDALIRYMDGGAAAAGGPAVQADQRGLSWSYWAWNADTGVTAGILGPDWTTPNAAVLQALRPAMDGAPGSAAMPTVAAGAPDRAELRFTVRLSTPSVQTVTVRYATRDGTAHAGTDYAPTSGTLVFAPGETVHTISAELLGDAAAGTLGFTLELSAPNGATLGAAASATATLVRGGATIALDGVSGAARHATVTVTNAGAIAVNAWQVEIDSADLAGPVHIADLTGATLLRQTGNACVFAGTTPLAAHGATTFGFVTDQAAIPAMTATLLRLGD